MIVGIRQHLLIEELLTVPYSYEKAADRDQTSMLYCTPCRSGWFRVEGEHKVLRGGMAGIEVLFVLTVQPWLR
jgi:hypothetical protein